MPKWSNDAHASVLGLEARFVQLSASLSISAGSRTLTDVGLFIYGVMLTSTVSSTLV